MQGGCLCGGTQTAFDELAGCSSSPAVAALKTESLTGKKKKKKLALEVTDWITAYNCFESSFFEVWFFLLFFFLVISNNRPLTCLFVVIPSNMEYLCTMTASRQLFIANDNLVGDYC